MGAAESVTNTSLAIDVEVTEYNESGYAGDTGTLACVRKHLLVVLVLLAAACSNEEAPFALVANSDLGVGPERLLLGLRTLDEGAPLEEPDRPIEVELFAPEDLEEPFARMPADFIWLVEDLRGVYAAPFTFPSAGMWAVRLIASDLPATDLTLFQVLEHSVSPAVGDPAPPSITPTLKEAPLELLTTDPAPDASFYEVSIVEAVGSGKPTVVVFATPAFCQTATCGPTLDNVKSIRAEYPAVNFVHVEVFDLARTPNELVPVPAVDEWHLRSEPWVFVIDADGNVAARFEGVVTPDELRAVLDPLA